MTKSCMFIWHKIFLQCTVLQLIFLFWLLFLQCPDNIIMTKSSHFILICVISLPDSYLHVLMHVFLRCAVNVMRMNTCHFIVVCSYPWFSYIVPDLSLRGFLKAFTRRYGTLSKRSFCGRSRTKISYPVFNFGSRPVTYFKRLIFKMDR